MHDTTRPPTQGSACLGCGYLLHALSNDAACPECGIGVGLSRRRSLIADDDVGTILALRRGVGGLGATLLGPAAVAILLLASLMADPSHGKAATGVQVLGALLLVGEAGWTWRNTAWLTSTTARNTAARRPARAAQTAAALGVPAALGVVLLLVTPNAGTGVDDGLEGNVPGACALAGWAAARFVWHLAMRRHLLRVEGTWAWLTPVRFALPSLLRLRALAGALVLAGWPLIAVADHWLTIDQSGVVAGVPLFAGLAWLLVTCVAVVESRMLRGTLRRLDGPTQARWPSRAAPRRCPPCPTRRITQAAWRAGTTWRPSPTTRRAPSAGWASPPRCAGR